MPRYFAWLVVWYPIRYISASQKIVSDYRHKINKSAFRELMDSPFIKTLDHGGTKDLPGDIKEETKTKQKTKQLYKNPEF